MTAATAPVRVARFNELVKPYLVIWVAFLLVMLIVGIPLALIWVLGPGQWWARHYYEKLLCEISDTELRFRKGIIFQIEKTIPLENIQDVTFMEGPLLRRFNLATLKFETAGQTAGQAHHMTLIGIVDAHEFRDEILRRRQVLRARSHAPPAAAESPEAHTALLRGISSRLDEIAALLRERPR
jgi:membrane protein YdbS with pleckstrin-like domain